MREATPRQRVAAECARRGREAFAAGCARLLEGDDSDVPLIQLLGGRTAPWALDPNREPAQRYWFRVWAARGLLWAWHDTATPALRTALRDEAWRVREMAAKVVARHLVGDLLADVVPLRDDPVPRSGRPPPGRSCGSPGRGRDGPRDTVHREPFLVCHRRRGHPGEGRHVPVQVGLVDVTAVGRDPGRASRGCPRSVARQPVRPAAAFR